MTDKEELKNALRVLVNYCSQYDYDVCHENRGRDFTPPHGCIFWDTCYFDAYVVCDTLQDVLEKLEND